jgi:hypothetical protein
VAAAVRNELDRRRLHILVRVLEDQVGPVDEAEVARYSAMLAEVNAAASGGGITLVVITARNKPVQARPGWRGGLAEHDLETA